MTNDIKVSFYEEKHKSQYNDFLKRNNLSMMYHTLKYKRLLEEYLNCESLYLIAEKGGRIVGILPMFVKNGKMGKVYNSLPYYGSNGGILYENDIARRLLIEKYNDIVSDDETLAATLISNPLDLECTYENLKSSVTDMRISLWTSLCYQEDHEKKLMDSFHSKTRNVIRKSLKSGLELVVENDIYKIHEIHRDNMIAIGAKPKEIRFLELIVENYEFEKEYTILYAYKNDEVVAALLLFLHKDTVEYYMPAIKNKYRYTQALSFLIYNAMVYFSRKGFSRWDWGGTHPSMADLYRFKKRFSTDELLYNYYCFFPNDNICKIDLEFLAKEYSYFYVVPYDIIAKKERI